MKRKVSIFLGCLMSVLLLEASRVKFVQEVSLDVGWNAFYLGVAPDETPDELFSSWPVNFVGAYDAAAFLETRQYSMSASSEGALVGGYRVWQRSDAGVTTLKGVAANTVYLCFATNAMSGVKIYGTPIAPRQTWHVSDQGTLNLVGISAAGETTLADYFDGLDVGNTVYKRLYGLKQAKVSEGDFGRNEMLKMGDVLAIDSTKVSDWSGVLNVSPMSGIDFGTNLTRQVLSVRNDGSKARTVRVTMQRGVVPDGEVPTVPMGLMMKDTTTGLGDGDWKSFSLSDVFEKELAVGETLKLSLAVDRTQYAAGTKGFYYGALLMVEDVDGGSEMRVVVPVEVTSDGGASSQTAWPKGIWILSAELNKVSFVGGEELVTNKVETVDKDTNEVSTYEYTEKVKGTRDVAAGGTMKVRLPMAVGRDGSMVLLQRLWYGHDTNGVLHVMVGSTESKVPLYSPRRISTAFLPTDQVKIAAESGGKFGAVARFPFVVGEKSNVNPMKHALHPQHDGLQFDFEKSSPSGDDLLNYTGTIKPEVFSITNAVNLTWTEGEGGTAWSPEETLTGELIWEFGGLRHEGTIRAKGSFTMKRISAASLEE